MRLVCFSLLAFVLSSTFSHAAALKVTVTVEAGDYERRETLVILPAGEALAQLNWASAAGQESWLQVREGRAWLVVSNLPKQAKAVFELGQRNTERDSHLSGYTRGDSPKKVFIGRTSKPPQFDQEPPLVTYQSEPGQFPRDNIKELFRRGAYLHPIPTLSGRTITDDFPPNHIHHHGLWWAWTKTEFDGRKPDFWNMGDGKGRVDFVAVDSSWSGPIHGGFKSRHRFVDMTGPKPVAALYDNWEVTAYVPNRERGYWFFDLISEQRCAGTNALKLPQYHYGGLGLRGNWAWNGAGKLNILTADGVTDRVTANTQKARWCDLWGKIDGAECGIAVLCHPSNFRAPQPMRVHPTEPFFCYAPQQGGDMEIKPGDTYVSRYRFVVHDGPPDRAELERLWNDYAHPPVVKVMVE